MILHGDVLFNDKCYSTFPSGYSLLSQFASKIIVICSGEVAILSSINEFLPNFNKTPWNQSGWYQYIQDDFINSEWSFSTTIYRWSFAEGINFIHYIKAIIPFFSISWYLPILATVIIFKEELELFASYLMIRRTDVFIFFIPRWEWIIKNNF